MRPGNRLLGLRMTSTPSHRRTDTLVLALLGALMLLIFVADTVTDYAIAAAVFHTPLLLIAIRFLSSRQVVLLAVGSIALTVISFALTRSGHYEAGLVNTAISIIAIGVTTYLGLKLKSAQAAAHAARERLLRLSRLTTLGQLSTSIAHEVSQPLAAIAASAGACQRWLDADPANVDKARATALRIVADAERAKNVLERVRSITRNEAPARTAFDLNLATREIIELSQGELLRAHIVLTLTLPEDLPQAYADRVQIQQVIGNLLLNAIEALSESGRPDPQIHIQTQTLQTGHVQWRIQDNGPGLPAQQRQHLFDTFWTTKQAGLGLGLTISRAIMDANNGHIGIQGDAGSGAVFIFTLPTSP